MRPGRYLEAASPSTPLFLTVFSLLVRALLAAALMLTAGTAGAATGTATTGATADQEDGSLGITLAGNAGHMAPADEDGGGLFVFADPPEVVKVHADGPADGILRPGDLIVAVDGKTVASREASRWLQHPRRGHTYTLTIERDDLRREVAITAGQPGKRRSDESTVEVTEHRNDGTSCVTSYTMDETGAVTRMSQRASSDGGARANAWFGLGLEGDVMYVKHSDDGQTYAYFDGSPEVYNVDPDSPAGRAGIRRGDLLVKVNGKRLDEDAGGRVWTVAKPGDALELSLVREGQTYTVRLVGEAPPIVTVMRDGKPIRLIDEKLAAGDGHLRFAGVLDNVDIEVRGLSDVQVTTTDEQVMIRTGETTVLLSIRKGD